MTGVPFLTCPLLALTGLDCPFCGGTRATFALAQADVGTALDYNALVVFALPLVAWVLVARVVPAVGGPSLPARWGAKGLRAAIVVAVAFAVVRNLPFAPFSGLKA